MEVKKSSYLSSQIQKRYENTGLGSPEGLQKISSGSNRIVYKIIDSTYGSEVEECVIKVPYQNSPENSEEIKNWEYYRGTEIQKYLVPIKDYGPNWLLMPFGESVPESLVDEELYEQLLDIGGTDISKDDFVYMSGNAANQRCCDFASL